jgi:hypothetical protein
MAQKEADRLKKQKECQKEKLKRLKNNANAFPLYRM